jgi:hypothetical protein
VHVDTPNVVRGILAALGDQQDVSTAVRNALQCFVEWKRTFPQHFEKINWSFKQRQPVKNKFKHRLNSALNYVLLVCIAYGCDLGQDRVVIKSGRNTNLSLELGPFKMVLGHTIGKGSVYAIQHSTNRSAEQLPSYNKDNAIKKLVTECIFDENVGELQSWLQKIFSSVPKSLRVDKEQFYHALFHGMISFMGSNFSLIEVFTGAGRADMIVQHCQLGRCIIEFKFNQSAQKALDQIELRDYSKYFRYGKVLCIGINISGSDPLSVTCAKKVLQIPEPEISLRSDLGVTEACFRADD